MNIFSKTIKWTYQYLRYVFKEGKWLFLKNLSNIGATLVTSVAAAYFLEPSVYGTYKYILALGTASLIFSLSGSGTTVLRAIARKQYHIYPYLIKKKFLISLIPSVFLLVVAMFYFLKGNLVFSTSFTIIAILQPFFDTTQLYQYYLNGNKAYKALSLTTILKNFITASGIAVIMIFFNSPLILVATYYLLHTSCSVLFFSLTYRNYDKNSETGGKTEEINTLNYTAHLSIMNILGKISYKLDQILAFHLLSPTTLAVYAFALLPVSQINGQVKTLSLLISPKYSHMNPREINKSIHKKAFILFLLCAITSFVYIITAPFIYKLMFPSYLDAVFYTQILSITLITMPTIFYSEALVAHEQKTYLYIIRTFVPSTKIFLLLLLTPFLGLLGLIIAYVTPYFLSMFLAIFLYKKFITKQKNI